MATFEVSGERFSLWTADTELIGTLEQLEQGEIEGFPNGTIAPGSGKADVNEPWGWHMEGDMTEIAEISIELCDGRPSMVEEDLDYWIETVGRFCPWNAELVELADYR